MSILTSLVSAWTFEDGGNLGLDSFGTNDLTNNNVATQVGGNAFPGVSGVRFTAASLQSLSIASNASLVMGGTSWEMTCWINFVSRPGAGFFPGIMGKTGVGGLEYLLYYNGTTSRMTAQASSAGTGPSTVSLDHASIANAQWFFLDVFFDLPNQTFNFWVNNSPATGTGSGQVALTDTFAGANQFEMGSTDFGAPFLDAVLDGANLWKRLLTATERTQLYRAGAGLEYPFPGTGSTRRQGSCNIII